MRDPLIATEDLADRLAEGGVRVVDGSWFMDGRDARSAWRDAHIPGAVFFDLDAVADRTSGLPHMLPQPELFAREVGDLGIAENDHIVVYDQAGLFSAARVWWTFRAMGALRVQVLDGGLPKWRSEGRRLDSGVSSRPAALFQARLRGTLIRTFDEVTHDLGAGGQIVDARPAARFRGEAPEPREGLRSGHMPGARSLPYTELLNSDGTMKTASDIRRLFDAAGVDPERPVTTTCGSGVTAAILALALARLGNETAAVYDGSWAEWGSRADAEVVTGPA
ncbi:MAG: 3-mercaptopyruvate sulfurtransferase [Caulobacteraceae bacterium]|nr:3-mercaptopyruvate sulfurtransferase [Caulobacteraceae bacterium]